jgi:hypothetical protein
VIFERAKTGGNPVLSGTEAVLFGSEVQSFVVRAAFSRSRGLEKRKWLRFEAQKTSGAPAGVAGLQNGFVW